MAVLAVLVLGVTGTAVALANKGGDEPGPDPYVGAYPAYSPTPTRPATYTPKGPPTGPLRRFPGRPSQVIGQVVDRQAGLAYARLAAPWHPIGIGRQTGGYEYTVQKPKFQWYGTVSSEPQARLLRPMTPTGPLRLRAAAELSVAEWARGLGTTKLTPIAGQPLRVSGRPAWLAGYRVTISDSVSGIDERIVVMVAVDTGRAVPGVVQATVAKPKYAMLPDINTVVSSVRVVPAA